MCIEDVRLGRKTTCIDEVVNVPNASWDEVVKASATRNTLQIGNPSAVTIKLALKDRGAAVTTGLPIAPGVTMKWCIRDDGDFVNQAIYGNAAGAGGVLLVVTGDLQVE